MVLVKLLDAGLQLQEDMLAMFHFDASQLWEV